jgi:predicted dehydrogenase
LADLNRVRLDRYGDKFGVAGRYEDYRQLLGTERPDVVSVCTWSDTHLAVVRDAVTAGVKAIFCEKPMADCAAAAVEMVEVCDSAGVILLVDHKRRFSRFHRDVAGFIRAGRLGDIQHAAAYYVSGVANTGSHLFDLLRLYFGEAIWVEARQSHRASPLPGDPNLDATLWFTPGFPVTLRACDTASFYILEIEILGTTGRLRVKTGTYDAVEWEEAVASAFAAEYRDLAVAEPPFRPERRPELLVAGISNLVACLDGRAEPLCTGIDGLRAIEIIEALMRSSVDGGRRIELQKENTPV